MYFQDLGIFYFESFIFICTFLLLNLFILIIIEQFEKYMGNKENVVDVFKSTLSSFRKV